MGCGAKGGSPFPCPSAQKQHSATRFGNDRLDGGISRGILEGVLTLAARLGLLLPVLAAAGIGMAQSQLKFEVASVKPSTEQTMSIRVMPGGRLVATAPLKLLIMKAYSLQYSRIIGGPEWINVDRFEIEAKAGQDANPAQAMPMLQSLLEDRFRMKVRRENRETPVYDLAVDKGGSKLAPSKVSECPPSDTLTPSAQPDAAPPAPCGQIRIVPSASGVRMEGDRVPIAELVRVLSVGLPDRPVLDRTNLTGLFDIRLHFIEERPGTPDSDSSGPTMFIAVQEQLGLKLESSKGPVEFLIIDHVEHPTAN
jgi:uncharacterized protein (TIGR03435 family)